jgi:inward rectifier potassium channel
MSKPVDPPPPPRRTFEPSGAFNTVRVGVTNRHHDVYHYLLTTSWPRFCALIGGVYVAVNAAFAALYLADGAGITGAQPGSFADAFFFSVHTMATIGYGSMVPSTPYTNALVAFEALFGLMAFAMATGLMFAKFSRPTARVVWSRVALVTPRNGVPHLVFRVANARENQIVEANMRVVMLAFETTAEGERIRRFHDLHLVRAQNPIFALTWLVMHPIDERSPLHGRSKADLEAMRAEILAILIGIDGTFAQTIHARNSYTMDEIVEGARFADVIRELPDGRREVDLSRIHDYVPAGDDGAALEPPPSRQPIPVEP